MIKILVDSSSDYSMEEIKQKGMEFVPLHITFGETTYADNVGLERNDFYRMLTESADFPKTSQPSPQDFLEIFEKAKENGDELICILISSSLSGTCQSATLAKSMADYDKIHIIDSLTATIAIKIMADYGLKLIEEGLSAEEIVARIENMKSRVKIAAGLDTLEYLRRGGRIGRAAAMVGELANLKPLISVGTDGAIDTIGKCLGKNKAVSQIIRFLETSKLDPEFPMYSVYTLGTANTEKLEQKLAASGYQVQAMHQIGATIGTHVGPGVFGVIYVITE